MKVSDHDVLLRYGLNTFQFPAFAQADIGVIRFPACSRYRLGSTNDWVDVESEKAGRHFLLYFRDETFECCADGTVALAVFDSGHATFWAPDWRNVRAQSQEI